MGGARITSKQKAKALEMRERWGYNLQAIADRLGIAKSAVHRIVGAYQVTEPLSGAKLAERVVFLYQQGDSPAIIARRLGRDVFSTKDIQEILVEEQVCLRRSLQGNPKHRNPKVRLCGNRECTERVAWGKAICEECIPRFDLGEDLEKFVRAAFRGEESVA